MKIEEVEERGFTFDNNGKVIDDNGNEYRDEKGQCVIFKSKAVNHEYICDECGKPATRNVQNWWHEYKIKRNGDTVEVNDWEGDTNEWYCDDCGE